MLAANVPVVFLGTFCAPPPLRATRVVAAALFAVLGVFILLHG
jgi:hypothetical protein